ncbi:hypothetical protein GCM10007275_18680 [Jeotgalicoccus coquinae]|uniref:Preprotein translocase subunit SecG n=1 Tax=Jeotgalicoccus coquinae TaxID=709509 RepID=A0A6V7RRF5_9STAP|nr:hypothetical protein [Jeotgalicoccus coquinae]MBB6423931.1 preprotein translocase subunit SecG [Jeotgalicoccus coquinae]GGE23854.1 hypothetical protein GCM10007275_18680 [Jeotgalicoccus coquinae]CAD2080397.1 hypothetical protein JEOCOQ751_01734 [Jeotgalicoccus coquinae]
MFKKYKVYIMFVLSIFILITLIILSPIAVDEYVSTFEDSTTATSEDLWNYSAAILTAVIAGLFIIFQVVYQKSMQNKNFRLNNRTKLSFSLERADITDKDAYLFSEHYYINLIGSQKLELLKKIYLDKKKSPLTFRIECQHQVATNIVIYYNFKAQNNTTYTKSISVGKLSEGQSKYFIIDNIMKNVLDNNVDCDFKTTKPEIHHIPNNIIDNKIIITFKTAANEVGIIEYVFSESGSKNNSRSIERNITQKDKLYYEKDSDFPGMYLDNNNKYINEHELRYSKLINLPIWLGL